MGLLLDLVDMFVGLLKTLYYLQRTVSKDIKHRELENVLKVRSGQFNIVYRNSTSVTEINREFLVPQRFDPNSFPPRLRVHVHGDIGS
jgi:hypothetical protein